MKKSLLFTLFLLGCVCQSMAQNLHYNKDGKFKIVQFTDVHYIYQDPRSSISIECIHDVLDAEKPELIIFTGDLIYGKPADKSMSYLLEEVSKHKIPFAVTFGNHDDELGMTREELYQLIKQIPYNVTSTTPGISGVTNYILPVSSCHTDSVAQVLYLFDSNSYSQINGVKGYAFIDFNQIQWYCEQSKKFTAQNQDTPVPSLAFFHIPLPEYNQASQTEQAPVFGIRKERACSSQLNSGLFAAMKKMGDIQGVFVGHDHDNDYAVMWHDILLAYGRYTGGNTVYNNLPNGARVIELTEGKPGFRTWIRLKNNKVEQEVTFPDSFLRLNK